LRLIVLGATSAIGEATARLYAADNASILLVGRNENRIEEIAADLRIRGAKEVETAIYDLAETATADEQLRAWSRRIGGADDILLCYGVLGDQKRAEKDNVHAEDILRINFNSAAAWCLASANLLEERGHGTLIVLGSVAGDRGRRANFVYGAAKAGLEALVTGISHRFAGNGPRAVIIKPGPTATPMTEGMKRDGLLWSTPEQVARQIYKSAKSGGPVAYAPSFWRYVMLIIRNIPNTIFNRMDI